MTGQVTVLPSHQLFTILKDTLCLKYNGKDDNLQWSRSSDCQLFYFSSKSHLIAKADGDKYCITWSDNGFMHYIDVSDGTTISCPKYIVTKLESFYQVKILEKKEIIYVLEILIMLQHLLHVNQNKLLYYSW